MASSKGQAYFAVATTSPIRVRSIPHPGSPKAPPPSPTDRLRPRSLTLALAGGGREGGVSARLCARPRWLGDRAEGLGSGAGAALFGGPDRVSPVGEISRGRLAAPPRPPPPAPMGRTAAAPHLRLGREGGRRRCRASERGRRWRRRRGGSLRLPSPGSGTRGATPARMEAAPAGEEGRRRGGRGAPSSCPNQRPPAADLPKKARLSVSGWAERRFRALRGGGGGQRASLPLPPRGSAGIGDDHTASRPPAPVADALATLLAGFQGAVALAFSGWAAGQAAEGKDRRPGPL